MTRIAAYYIVGLHVKARSGLLLLGHLILTYLLFS